MGVARPPLHGNKCPIVNNSRRSAAVASPIVVYDPTTIVLPSFLIWGVYIAISVRLQKKGRAFLTGVQAGTGGRNALVGLAAAEAFSRMKAPKPGPAVDAFVRAVLARTPDPDAAYTDIVGSPPGPPPSKGHPPLDEREKSAVVTLLLVLGHQHFPDEALRTVMANNVGELIVDVDPFDHTNAKKTRGGRYMLHDLFRGLYRDGAGKIRRRKDVLINSDELYDRQERRVTEKLTIRCVRHLVRIHGVRFARLWVLDNPEYPKCRKILRGLLQLE